MLKNKTFCSWFFFDGWASNSNVILATLWVVFSMFLSSASPSSSPLQTGLWFGTTYELVHQSNLCRVQAQDAWDPAFVAGPYFQLIEENVLFFFSLQIIGLHSHLRHFCLPIIINSCGHFFLCISAHYLVHKHDNPPFFFQQYFWSLSRFTLTSKSAMKTREVWKR